MNRLLLEPPPTLSDERLAQLSAEGFDSAFAMLVLRHRRTLVRHCAALVGPADAEEVVQEALLRAYLALARGEAVNHVGPWLRAIAHNSAVNLLRARAARPVLSGHEPGPERTDADTFERRESLREVVRALEDLPDRQRQALVMRELEGRSYAEIEARLNTSNGAVRQLLNRARAAVRDRLDAVAGLIPAIRWILADGGRAATAARLGALSGGCAVTIKLCTATVLPTVLVPGATASKPPSSAHHAATVSGQPLAVAAPTARAPSGRAALATRALFAPRASHRGSSPNPPSEGAVGASNASQPRTRAWSRRSSSRTGVGSRWQGGAARGAPGATATRNGSATAPGRSAGASPTPLEMGPNVRWASATGGGNVGSPLQGSTGSPAAKGGGSSTGQGFASTQPAAGATAPATGPSGGQSGPRPGPGSS